MVTADSATTQVAAPESSPLQEFFSARTVFVTGATGFLGKVLVEKLLRSCPGVARVYVLIRSKKGRSIQQRVDDMFGDQVFWRVQQSRGKVRPVVGDVSLPGLGLSAEDRLLLAAEVSVVFHVAATVRFNEQLTVATAINVRGTREVTRLARDMPQLQALVHVSTAYSQCRAARVEERVYDSPVAPSTLLAMLDGGHQPSAEHVTRIMGDYPNTYVFTKAVAEQLVKEEGAGMPVGIFRPAMVVATAAEPLEGWIDNVYGPTGICVAASVGLLKVVHCDERALASIVPCDMVVNALIACAWDVATGAAQSGEPPVYNFVSSCDAPLPWRAFMELYHSQTCHSPPLATVWGYSLRLTTSRALYAFYKYVVHLAPALVVDATLALATGKPKMVSAYRRIHQLLDLTSYFSSRDWNFDNGRTTALFARLAPRDRQLFPFDLRGFQWDRYFQRYVSGVRRYVLKEDPSSVPLARRRWNRLHILDEAVRMAAMLSVMWVAWNTAITVGVF